MKRSRWIYTESSEECSGACFFSLSLFFLCFQIELLGKRNLFSEVENHIMKQVCRQIMQTAGQCIHLSLFFLFNHFYLFLMCCYSQQQSTKRHNSHVVLPRYGPTLLVAEACCHGVGPAHVSHDNSSSRVFEVHDGESVRPPVLLHTGWTNW